MADMIVSPVIEFVMQRVVAYLKDRINLHSGVEEKLKKLEVVLNRIQPVANTAEEVDLEKHKDLKPWMRDLKVAVEEAKDVVDEFEYLRLKSQAEGDEVRSSPSPSSGKRVKGIARRIFTPSAKKINPSTDLLKRLEGIQIKLEELDSRAVQFLQLVADRKATDREHHNQYIRKRETSSSVVERELVGRKELLEEIISKLMEEEEHISVIAVVGHGGMGKTTLAQHIFNDPMMESHFQVRMWAHVSQVFDVLMLTKKILESATRTERCADTDSSLETLQQKLKDVLKSKRFLLVLDDVWYSQPNGPFAMEEEWNKLCSPLAQVCGKGSKILLTSRIPKVKELSTGALMIKSMILLQGLTQDECWSIIRTIAFRGREIPDGCRDLEEIGIQIALKVDGSPLAAKAVGGILRKELHWRHWLTILNMKFLELPGSGIMPVLMLSYQYLPPHLRQCFAYCALFPKGYQFGVDMLVRMWVAHGYIQDRPYGEMTEEDIGISYFVDMLSAGFFTGYFNNDREEIYVVMHDLMNDLARFVTREEIHQFDEETQSHPIPKTVRHLSVRTSCLAVLNKNRCNLSDLESFLLIPYDRNLFGDAVELDNMLVKEVLQQLRRVRVLDVNYCNVYELPDDISHWLHLRYLDLSRTDIDRLPDSLMVLYHLQVLNMAKFFERRHLEIRSPDKLNNLVNLRFLCMGNRLSLKLTCIRGLKSLQMVVGNLSVEEGRGSEIRNLKALNDLKGGLHLKDLHYIESEAVAREAELCRKNRLQRLSLKWGGDCSPDVAKEVLEGLQPPKCLELLAIDSYPGMVCPSWISIPFLEKLFSISLSNLFHLECLPPVGQLPFLYYLRLERLPRLRKLSHEGFPSLKILQIYEMEEVEEWSGLDGSGGLPYLTCLSITECPKMRMLPTLSHTVTELKIINVGISSLPGLVAQGITNSGSSSSSGIISLPSDLSTLWIENCGNLTSLGEDLMQNQQRLRHLRSVTIIGCELLVSLPDGGFQELKSLRYLKIQDCPNLTWLVPREVVDSGLLPSSLEELTISRIGDNALSRCLQGLNRLSKQQAYLTSLQKLSISSCQALAPSALEKVLHAPLPSLKVLSINGCPESFLETWLFPATDAGEGMAIQPWPLALERLSIDNPLMLINVPVLKSLTSVQRVEISDASRLISFSPELEEWLLQIGTSLRKLRIYKAQKLQSLPKLPDSLEELHISDADQEFKKRYERDTGCDWYKIRHIKHIIIS